MRPKDLDIRGGATCHAYERENLAFLGGGVILGEKCEEETREVRGKRERVASNEKEL